MIYRRIRWIIFSPFLYSPMVFDSFPIFLSLYIIRIRQNYPWHIDWRNTFCGLCIKYWFEVYIIIGKKVLRRKKAWNQMKKFEYFCTFMLFFNFLVHKFCFDMFFSAAVIDFANFYHTLINFNPNVISLNFNHYFYCLFTGN